MLLFVLSFLGVVQTFQKSKCKKLLDTTIERINILQKRHEVQLRHMSQRVSHLLILGESQSAQVWLERLWKELCMLSVYNKVQEYCNHVKKNLSSIASSGRQCSSDLQEPVAALCRAASRCSQLPELKKLCQMFTMKYGSEIEAPAQEMKATSHVNQLLLDSLCTKGPPDNLKEELNRCLLRQSNKEENIHKELLDLLSRSTRANVHRHLVAPHHGCKQLDDGQEVLGECSTMLVADERSFQSGSLHSYHNYELTFKNVSKRPRRRQSFKGSNRACVPPDYELVAARVAELSAKT